MQTYTNLASPTTFPQLKFKMTIKSVCDRQNVKPNVRREKMPKPTNSMRMTLPASLPKKKGKGNGKKLLP